MFKLRAECLNVIEVSSRFEGVKHVHAEFFL